MNDRQSYPALARALLVLGLPLIGSNLAQMALHVTDTVMLGWYGTVELASAVLGASTFFIIFILGSGFALAVTPLVASALGRGMKPACAAIHGWGCGCRSFSAFASCR